MKNLLSVVCLYLFVLVSPMAAAEDIRCKVDCNYCEYGCTVEEGEKRHLEKFCERNPNHSRCKSEEEDDDDDGGDDGKFGKEWKCRQMGLPPDCFYVK